MVQPGTLYTLTTPVEQAFLSSCPSNGLYFLDSTRGYVSSPQEGMVGRAIPEQESVGDAKGQAQSDIMECRRPAAVDAGSSSSVCDSWLELPSQKDHPAELLLAQLDATEPREAEPKGEEDRGYGPVGKWGKDRALNRARLPAAELAPAQAETPPAEPLPAPPAAPSPALEPQPEPASESPSPPAAQLGLLLAPQQWCHQISPWPHNPGRD
ncbi:hypothetical protein GW7_07441 [Heterocephalus glaber]|uniref:Uncharacterized protein n=1 Tax=Heterocephalus glaber TaxID=10181 RepID=G5B657_HETGA|nr:hypothetical protein GW7_07441 [Heterocephalus glaber]